MASIVAGQVVVMFTLIIVGMLCSKTGIFTEEATGPAVNLLLLVVTPAIIVGRFMRPAAPGGLRLVLVSAAVVVVITLLGMVMALLLIRKREGTNYSIERVVASAPNAGFMGIPLITAALGQEAMIYAAIYVALFQIFNWTYFARELGGPTHRPTVKKLLTNPAIISIAVGFLCYALQVTLPTLMLNALDYLANLNTGLSMVVMGVFLANVKLRDLKFDRHAWWALALRLLVVPVVTLLLLKLLGVGALGAEFSTPVMADVIGCACPAAVVVILMSKRTGRCDPRYGSALVAASTLLSLITLPLVVGLAERIL